MNHAARFVLWVLGIVLIIFAFDIVVSPWFGHEPAKAAQDNMATLIVAFVGILAKTGPTETPQPVQVVNKSGDAIPVNEQVDDKV